MRPSTLAVAAMMLSTIAPAIAAEPVRPAGARPGDKDLSCEAIVAERGEINAAVKQRAADGTKRKGTMFGFGKKLFTHVLPVEAARIGGLGGRVAMKAAGQASVAADNAPAPTSTPTPTQPERDRLARLESIATYRECSA